MNLPQTISEIQSRLQELDRCEANNTGNWNMLMGRVEALDRVVVALSGSLTKLRQDVLELAQATADALVVPEPVREQKPWYKRVLEW